MRTPGSEVMIRRRCCRRRTTQSERVRLLRTATFSPSGTRIGLWRRRHAHSGTTKPSSRSVAVRIRRGDHGAAEAVPVMVLTCRAAAIAIWRLPYGDLHLQVPAVEHYAHPGRPAATAGVHTPMLSVRDLRVLPAGDRRVRNVWLDVPAGRMIRDRKSTRLNSSHVKISYAVFCLKKKKK